LVFSSMLPRPPRPTLFPYTTLFRSWRHFPPADRKRPTPWDEARCGRASTYSAPAHRRWRSCTRVPYADRRRGREASPARNIFFALRMALRRETDFRLSPIAQTTSPRSVADRNGARFRTWPEPFGRSFHAGLRFLSIVFGGRFPDSPSKLMDLSSATNFFRASTFLRSSP